MEEKNLIAKRPSHLPAYLISSPEGFVQISQLSDEELYKKCREYGQNAKLWSRKFAGLLPEVAKRGFHRRKGFRSLGEFASKVAGMSEYAVDRILQIHAKIKDKPYLLRLFESGAEGWSKIEVVAYVATIETDRQWAEKIPVLSTTALSELVRNYRLKSPDIGRLQSENLFGQGCEMGSEMGRRGSEVPVRFSFPASREVEFDLRLTKHKLEKQSKQVLSWNETFQMLIQKNVELEKSLKVVKDDKDLRKSNLFEKPKTCTRCAKKITGAAVCENCAVRGAET